MSDIGGETTFKITNAKLYVPIVTLLNKDNVKLIKQLNQGFKIVFLAFNNTTANVADNQINNTNNRVIRDSHRKHFLSREDITNFHVLIDGRNFYDQPIRDQIKKYDEIREGAPKQGDNYTSGCLLNYQYFRDHYQLITVNFRKQVELDADPRAIQQIEFNGIRKTNAQVCTIFFNAEIQERKIMSKKLSIYIATFDYFDNTLIVLSATR